MSNVLIGIIGVILFIGLALAGALFLGPRFQESTNNSKASAAVQAVAQVSSAANMATVQNGYVLAATAANAGAMADVVGASGTEAAKSLKGNGFLKSVPTNPLDGTNSIALLSSAGSNSAGDAHFAVMPIGSNDAVCNAISRQSGSSDPAPSVTNTATLTTAISRPSGCFKATAVVGSLTAQNYAFSRL
jgi:hypothetical protein